MSFATAFSNYNPQYLGQAAQQVAAAPVNMNAFAPPMSPSPFMPQMDPSMAGAQGGSILDRMQGWGAGNTNVGGGGGAGFKNWLKGDGNLSAVAGIGSSLVGAFLGWQQLKHAKDQLGFQKEAFNTNLTNSIQSYNTSLEDRIRGRSANPNESDVQNYLNRHSLKRQK